jgi:hypothetical protein
MTQTEKRNLGGSLLCFLSSCLFGGLAVAYWMAREGAQAEENHTEIEKDDIARYSLWGGIGSIINLAFFALC